MSGLPAASRHVAGALLFGAMLSGCAATGGGGEGERPRWPYPGVHLVATPPELLGRPQFMGRWIAAEPQTGMVLAESTDPRFIAQFSMTNPRSSRRFMDLGYGTEVENLAFVDRGDAVVLVGAAFSPHSGQLLVDARSLLRIDLVQNLLIDAIPLPRHGHSRGFAVDSRSTRGYLLHDNGTGDGTVQAVDLYSGDILATQLTGPIPRGVGRRGVVVDRTARYVYCLSGGESARSDFQPVTPGVEAGPELLVLDGESLSVISRIPMNARFEPIALAYNEDDDRLYVLQSNLERSLLVAVSGAFLETTIEVSLPEKTTDLVVTGGFAFCPGSAGIYVVDLALGALAGRPNVAFEFTGEIAVSGNLDSAYVLFQSATSGGPPGIARVSLSTGEVLDVLQ